jgi:Ring finger domain
MSDADCAICTEKQTRSSAIACVHRFCLECIRAWSHTTNLCPLCKVEFRWIDATDPTERVFVRRKRQQAEYDSDEIARFDVSSESAETPSEHSDDTDEYELDGFVVADDASVDRSDASSSETESDVQRPRLRPRTSQRRVPSER